MIRYLAIAALLLAAVAPSAAQSATGMAAMQYYVGNWSCMAGETGQAKDKANVTYTLDEGVLRMWVVVPKQGKMTKDYAFESATVYDSKSGRYMQSSLGTDAGWSISTAKPWSGNTEQWTDMQTSMGKPGRGETVRTSQNAFTFRSYPTVASTKSNFGGTCTRSS